MFVVAALAVAQANAPQPAVDIIVARMMAAIQEKARSQSVTLRRDYQLFDKKWESKAQIVVRITFEPPDRRRYDIESSRGGVGERILRDILNREMESPDAASQKAFSPENYDFQLLGEEMLDGHLCYLLALHPRREEKNVIRGRAWVDAETYRLHRVEGEPVKSPSWWIHDLHIVMSFAEIDGIWMRTVTHAVANVRFKGRYVMVSRNIDYVAVPAESSFQPDRNREPGVALRR